MKIKKKELLDLIKHLKDDEEIYITHQDDMWGEVLMDGSFKLDSIGVCDMIEPDCGYVGTSLQKNMRLMSHHRDCEYINKRTVTCLRHVYLYNNV